MSTYVQAKPILGRVSLLLAMVMMLLPARAPLSATAQTTDASYEFSGGQTITWGDDWELDEESIFTDGGIESVLFFRGVSVLSVLSVPNDFDLNEARDIFLDSFLEAVGDSVTIDRGSYGQVSYSLDLVNSDGFENGVFTLFRAGSGNTPTFAYVFFAEVSEFADEFSSAQTAFQLDGAGLFDGVEGQGLQDLLEANTGSAPPAPDDEQDVPPDANEGTTDETEATPGADEPSDGSDSGGLKGGDTNDDPVDDATNDDDADDDPDRGTGDPEGQGLVEDGYYVSPLFLAELTWDDTYAPDTGLDVYVSSNEVDNVDFLALASTGEGPAFLSLDIFAAEGATPAELVEIWQSAEFVADTSISPGAEVMLADSSAVIGGVVMRDSLEDGTEVIRYREVHYLEDEDALAIFTFTSVPGYAETALLDAQNGIELNGQPVLDFFTVEEMLAEF